MIGCVAKATSYEVLLNTAEMEDVQWYDRQELLQATQMYGKPGVPLQEVQKRSWHHLGFFIPPPFAVAYHLIHTWATRTESWFPQPVEAVREAAAAGAEDAEEQEQELEGKEDGESDDVVKPNL